jgi:arylsulfatase A-like enzyme
MGIVANTHIGHGYNFDQGFELFSENPLVPVPGEHQRFGDDVSNAAIDFLHGYARQRRGQSFFLFLHYFDVHTPYRKHAVEPSEPLPPEALRFKARAQRMTRRYDAEILFVDQQIRRVVEASRSSSSTATSCCA